ncbi:MAG TPA: XRE family transcriptional regulator [Pyrinomonadaceae bacterium]|jgi:Zn-dependent peptidase ImmA (M78 family)/transcriptional regulator with XRE-family HTH domain
MMLTHAELGRCLQAARKRLRLSQTAVASQLKVTRQVVSAYESGKRAVSAPELQLLCNLFRLYPNDLLGFTGMTDQPFATTSAFRMNAGIFELSENDRREVEEVTKRVPPDSESYLARWKKSSGRYVVKERGPFWSMPQLAESVRLGLSQDEPPINVYLMAEQLGVYVTPTLLDKAAAVVNRADESRRPPTPPWILVNSTQPVERQRYSIGHEIAHLLLHDEELIVLHPHYYRRHFDQRETDAESFAAELLMPRDLIEHSVRNLKVKDPVEEAVFILSYLYQVSFTAMATRLYNLNMITRAAYNHLTEIKPSRLEGAARKPSGKRAFKPEKFIPGLAVELGLDQKPRAFDQDAVRRMQEIAYTRYLGQETKGGANPAALYSLESPARVYERVAVWLADQYPMNKVNPSC